MKIQERKIMKFHDYLILLNSEPTANLGCLILTNSLGESLFVSFNKNDIHYIIKALFDYGEMSEHIYSNLYDKIYELNRVVKNPIEN